MGRSFPQLIWQTYKSEAELPAEAGGCIRSWINYNPTSIGSVPTNKHQALFSSVGTLHRRRCDQREGFHDGDDGRGIECFRDDSAEDQATVGGVHGNDFQGGTGADLHMDIAGQRPRPPGGEGEAAGEEMEAAVAALVEDDGALAIKDKDAGGGETVVQPVAEAGDPVEKRAAGGGLDFRGGLEWGI